MPMAKAAADIGTNLMHTNTIAKSAIILSMKSICMDCLRSVEPESSPSQMRRMALKFADAMSALVESGRTEAPQSNDNGSDQAVEDGDDGAAGAMVPVA